MLGAVHVDILVVVVSLGYVAVVACRSEVERKAWQASGAVGDKFPIAGKVQVLVAECLQRAVIAISIVRSRFSRTRLCADTVVVMAVRAKAKSIVVLRICLFLISIVS